MHTGSPAQILVQFVLQINEGVIAGLCEMEVTQNSTDNERPAWKAANGKSF